MEKLCFCVDLCLSALIEFGATGEQWGSNEHPVAPESIQ